MKCPKCGQELEPFSPKDAKELIVDRCPSCEGFWLDKGELEQMQKVADKADVRTLKNMTLLQRPADWSWIRWSIYCFKKCSFKTKS